MSSINRRRFITTTLAGAPALAVPALPLATAPLAVGAGVHPDAVLLAAARQILLLRAQIAAEESDEDDSYQPVFALEDVIAHTPAATLHGAIIKLRWLKNELAVILGDEDEDESTQVCCRQVIALLESELATAAA